MNNEAKSLSLSLRLNYKTIPMKKLLLLALGVAVPVMASASAQWVLSKAEWPYRVDTLYHAAVGPGTTFTEMSLTSLPRPSDGKVNDETPFIKSFYLTVDLTHPDIVIKSYLAGDKRNVRQTLPVMADSHDSAESGILAGVNSDFFNMSLPYLTNGAAVTDGFMKAPQNAAPWVHIMLDKDKNVSYHGDVGFYRSISFDDGTSESLGVNVVRNTGAYVIYFHDYEAPASRNQWGCEVLVRPVGDVPWKIGSQQWEVVGDPTAPNSVNSTIEVPEGGYVLSGNGAAATRISALKKGDRFTVAMSAVSGGSYLSPDQLAGGRQMILTDGVQIDVSSSNAPRTLVGTSEDGKTMVLMCIDGRQAGGSYGAYYRLCAAIMQAVGCHNAMEFDGGGSTTMYVKPLGGVRNVPSEGELRAVAEGLFLTYKPSGDSDVVSIEVVEKGVVLQPGESFTPTVYGFNSHGELVDSDLSGFVLECGGMPSAISADGRSFSSDKPGMYALKVSYGAVETTIAIHVSGDAGISDIIADSGDILLSPNPVLAGSPVKISGASGKSVVAVYSMSGACMSESIGDIFPAPGTAGIYLVTIDGKNTVRLLVQ